MRTLRPAIVLVLLLAALAAGLFMALGDRVAAGPDSVPSAAPPNPGHGYDQIELPVGTWSGLDADMLDGLNSDQIQDADDYVSTAGALSRPGFSTTTAYGARCEFTSVTVGTDGLPFVACYDYANKDLKVVHCGDATCSSGNTVTTVDSTGDVGEFTSVTVGADGLPLISYSANGSLEVAHCGDVACTSSTTSTVDGFGSLYGTSATVGADGLPVISYYNYVYANLNVAHCGNAACTSGNTLTTVDSTGDVGRYSSVTVGADGLPVISYYDATNGDVKVAHCGDALCSSGNTVTTVDSDGTVGEDNTSVTVGVDGLPVISYRDNSNGDLKVAHCGNAACNSGNTITSVDGADIVGEDTSVTVGADGLPVISYYDYTNGDLKVAHCGNAACTSSTTTTVDGDGETGWNSSVTVGADGLPLISYYDHTDGDLKVIHCSNRFCVPHHRPR